jgi:RHS repeat-associated protein
MGQPGRKFSATTGYRYGFNGKENDNEVKGEGNQQDYGMRIFDPRLGKFLSVDKLTSKYPELTPYQFASNRPIDGSDLDGNEWTTEVTIENAGTPQQVVTKAMIVRVKVENNSKIMAGPDVVRAKAELYKKSLEEKYKLETTEVIEGVATKVIYKTEVILDYTPRTENDLGTIAHLVFEDRVSTPVIKDGVEVGRMSEPGSTNGQINGFTTRIALTMDGKVIPEAKLPATMNHEGGHSASLSHPWSLRADEKLAYPELDQKNPATMNKKKIKNNLLNSDENKNEKLLPNNNNNDLLPSQIIYMFKKIDSEKMFTPKEIREGPK